MLKNAIETGQIGDQTSALRAEEHCSFGKWLHGQTIAEQDKNSVHYHQARELHAAFHEAASKSIQLAAAGKKDVALKMLEVSGELTVASAALTTCMLSWLIEVKKQS